MQLVLKELRESLFWLKLIKKSDFLLVEDLQPTLDEADELVKIFAKSVVTAKSRKK
jgi:four helix bundle protein